MMAKLKKKKAKKIAKKFKKKILRKVSKKKPAKRRKVLVGRAKAIKRKPKKVFRKKIKRVVKLRKIVRKKIVVKKHRSAHVNLKKIIARKKKVIKPIKIKGFAPRKNPSMRLRARRKIAESKPAGFDSEALFKAKIKVIGIGGGGGSIVSEIGRSLEKATFVIADTDIRALKKKSGIKYLWFGQDLTHGLGTGVNVELAKQAAEMVKEKISAIFKDQDIIIFVASLGGGLGSGATQVFAEAAREFGGITFGIFTMPFKFEGKNKQRVAQNALKSLRQSLNVSLVIPNEKIFKVIDPSTPITSAFSTVNKSLIESLESLIDLIYNPGIINIDFADLRTILRGRGSSAFLNTAEESGKDRAEKICKNVLVNPLLQNNSFETEKILFNIAGAENLSMFEVEKISSHIANLNPKAKIIFGISKDNKLNNKIKTTILMTGGQIKEEAPAGFARGEPVEKDLLVQASEPEKIIVVEKSEPPKKIGKLRKKVAHRKEKPTEKSEEVPISLVPVFEQPIPVTPIVEQKKMEIIEMPIILNKKTIRRSGLEIRKAEEQAEKKKLAQEKEWEIPAFLRKMKIKN
jgi:cell division protein FtsZ